MSINTYVAGTLVRETGNFCDVNGDLADPTTVTLQYQPGAGEPVARVTYGGGQVTRAAQGVYYYDIDTSGWTGPGTALYTAQWVGTGNVQAVEPDYFQVEAPPITLP